MIIFLMVVLGYFIAGQLAVMTMAPAIARKNTKTELQYKWVGDKGYSVAGDTYWLLEGIKPNQDALFTKTGETRGGGDNPYLETQAFAHDLKLMRWLWFAMVPNHWLGTDTQLMIEKYDPATRKRKEDEYERKMTAMKTRLDELEAAETRARELEANEFENRFEQAT